MQSSRAIDMSGRRFGRLLVVEPAGHDRNRQAYWRCRCDCGNEVVTRGTNLRMGKSRSCGCLSRDLVATRRFSHGMWATPTYYVWNGMRQRCSNPNYPGFQHYGGRGITVCARWQSFENFLADMGERPADPSGWKGKRAYWSIDRVDVDGNYEPGNCRWASPSMQVKNQRSRAGMVAA